MRSSLSCLFINVVIVLVLHISEDVTSLFPLHQAAINSVGMGGRDPDGYLMPGLGETERYKKVPKINQKQQKYYKKYQKPTHAWILRG